MTTLAALNMIDRNALQWPVTLRFHVLGPQGNAQQEMTWNVIPHQGDINSTIAFALLWWEAAVSTLTTATTVLWKVDMKDWRGGGVSSQTLDQPIAGRIFKPSAPRGSSPCFQLHTGRQDGYALRRFHFFGTPADESEDGLLTDAALLKYERIAQAWKVAGERSLLTCPMPWMLAFPRVGQSRFRAGFPVGLRYVEYVRVMHHTSKAPAPSLNGWP